MKVVSATLKLKRRMKLLENLYTLYITERDIGQNAGVRYKDFVNMDEHLAVSGKFTDAEVL